MAGDDGNERVTLALLGERMDQALKRLDRIEANQERQLAAQAQANTNYTACSTTQAERWKQHEQEHGAMSRKAWAADIVGPVLAVLAGWLKVGP
jgi:hypothetical protein